MPGHHDLIVAIARTVMVEYDKFSNPHTYDDLMGKRTTIRHNKNGDAIYGLDLLIHSDYRGFRLGRRLYDARKDLCRQFYLRAILAGGRIPMYHKHKNKLGAAAYLEAVKRREIYDPILTFQLSNDFQVTRLLRRYMPEDEKSQGYATLLEWSNSLYESSDNVLENPKTVVGVGALQWQMRQVASVEDVLLQVAYFIDALSSYKSDIAVFPEFFNAALMGLYPDRTKQNKPKPFGFSQVLLSISAMKFLKWQ